MSAKKQVEYFFASKKFEYIDQYGEERVKKVCDWEKAERCDCCEHLVCHQFFVDGKIYGRKCLKKLFGKRIEVTERKEKTCSVCGKEAFTKKGGRIFCEKCNNDFMSVFFKRCREIQELVSSYECPEKRQDFDSFCYSFLYHAKKKNVKEVYKLERYGLVYDLKHVAYRHYLNKHSNLEMFIEMLNYGK